jgi:hypothetical protein
LACLERGHLSTDQETLSRGILHLFRSFSNGTPRTTYKLVSYTGGRMDAEQTIVEIELLERIFAAPEPDR